MAQMNMIQAINSAHKVMMARDHDIVVFGEDIGYFGGVFRATEGLQREFGSSRVFDAPISEGGIVATAVGMAAYGLKPVVEIQFADYIYPGYDQIVSEVAKIRYRTAGEWAMPMVIRSPYGGGIFGGQTHSQSPESLFTHIAGLKVVIPSTPHDGKGLLIAAIEDPDPVIFFEPKRIYNGPFDGDPNKPAVPWSTHTKGSVPEGHYKVPIGKCDIVIASTAAPHFGVEGAPNFEGHAWNLRVAKPLAQVAADAGIALPERTIGDGFWTACRALEREHDLDLRPHVKTHKCVEIARLQVALEVDLPAEDVGKGHRQLDVLAGTGGCEAHLVAQDGRQQVTAAVVGDEVDLGGVDANRSCQLDSLVACGKKAHDVVNLNAWKSYKTWLHRTVVVRRLETRP